MRASKVDICKNVFITDISEEFNLKLEECYAGNFDHRCRCPAPDHKAGNERTSSLYIDSVNNNFYCFGCGANSSVIDFYMICSGKQFSSAIRELESRVPDNRITGEEMVRREDTLPKLLELSGLFRKAIVEHGDDFEWINRLMKKTDDNMSNIDEYDLKSVTALSAKVEKILRERYK